MHATYRDEECDPCAWASRECDARRLAAGSGRRPDRVSSGGLWKCQPDTRKESGERCAPCLMCRDSSTGPSRCSDDPVLASGYTPCTRWL